MLCEAGSWYGMGNGDFKGAYAACTHAHINALQVTLLVLLLVLPAGRTDAWCSTLCGRLATMCWQFQWLQVGAGQLGD
jgi:hypothetical protein